MSLLQGSGEGDGQGVLDTDHSTQGGDRGIGPGAPNARGGRADPVLVIVLIAAVVICLVSVALISTSLVSSNDDGRFPYATLTPTRGSNDTIRYDISDVAGSADYKDMIVYVGQGNDSDDIWSEAKFAVGESGYYEARLTLANATYLVVVNNLDRGTLLSDGNYLTLKRTSGPFEDGTPYLLRLRDKDGGIWITSSSYYSH